MFSLIIAIVSIALVVALVAATMYHGGDTLTQGRAKADAAALVSGAQQVGGAAVMQLSMQPTATVDTATLLANKYLSSKPVGVDFPDSTALTDLATAGVVGTRLVTGAAANDEVCKQVNISAGAPAGADLKYTVTGAGITSLPYGCISADKTFVFKY